LRLDNNMRSDAIFYLRETIVLASSLGFNPKKWFYEKIERCCVCLTPLDNIFM